MWCAACQPGWRRRQQQLKRAARRTAASASLLPPLTVDSIVWRLMNTRDIYYKGATSSTNTVYPFLAAKDIILVDIFP